MFISHTHSHLESVSHLQFAWSACLWIVRGLQSTGQKPGPDRTCKFDTQGTLDHPDWELSLGPTYCEVSTTHCTNCTICKIFNTIKLLPKLHINKHVNILIIRTTWHKFLHNSTDLSHSWWGHHFLYNLMLLTSGSQINRLIRRFIEWFTSLNPQN